ncbi:hypothetical protein BGZ51_005876 [Haplosporangium sp. Z 767]|nr:hypothetical protein BGZ51_005876 [Haplosporangium sp. Z 767]KAF9192139.1 hypothetical protein BGZ50_008782 [Haplosporangium sp. Z 11]
MTSSSSIDSTDLPSSRQGPARITTFPISEISAQDPEKGGVGAVHSVNGSEADTTEETIELDPVAVKKLRAKIDRRLIPLLSILYLCSFLDRVNIGNAKVAGLATDLNLAPSEYNWALSIFFIGYVLFEVPSNMCLKRIGPRIWISFIMFVWGLIMMCMAAARNAAGLMASRFFLGVAECGLFPGVIYLFSLWYTRNEQALRTGIFFCTATLAGSLSGLLAYWIAHMEGVLGLYGWQWIFLLEGLPTVLLSGVALWLLPNWPETAPFLSKEERELASLRLKIDAGKADQTEFSWKQFWSVFIDWKTYCYMITFICSTVPMYSLALFMPSIVSEFNLNPFTTQLMTVPAYAIACIFTLLNAYSSDRLQERGFHFAASTATSSIGYILLIVTKENGILVRYICLTITAIGNFSASPPMVSWFTCNSGGHTKRGVAIAAIISFGNIGGVIAGQVYQAPDAVNGYIQGHTICASLLGFSLFVILTTKYLLARENRRRDRLTPEEYAREAEGDDLCDNHPAWRYWT